MSNAVERLAAELMKIPDDEWARITERRIAGQDWNAAFGPAWDEISERLARGELMQAAAADQAYRESTPSSESHSGIIARGKA